MRKVNIQILILLLLLFTSILIFIIDGKNIIAISIFAIITILIIGWTVVKSDGKRITFSTALLLYTCATQFGLIIPFAIGGREILSNYSDWTLAFLRSDSLFRAVTLGCIAVLCLEIGVQFSRSKYEGYYNVIEENEDKNGSATMYAVGLFCLGVVLFFFLINIATGGMRLFGTYQMFMQSSTYNSSLYTSMIILFYVGTIYLASAGKIIQHRIGWSIWITIVLILALNGNKGEFLYAVLAVLGLQGVQGKEVSGKMAILILSIVFGLIPLITSLRSIGIVGNVSRASFEPFEAFTEMGMQIRMSVYSLEALNNGTIHYLYGKSYLQPIFNIITPFLSHTQATAEIRSQFPGFGYSQVIESYVNFKIIGTILFFFIIGFFVGKQEMIVKNKVQLAYLGTIVCILINATRNYFAFVPGQILIVTIISLVVRRISVKRGGV